MKKRKKYLARMLILTILVQMQVFTPMVTYAANALDYANKNVDTELHVDGYLHGYQNVCNKRNMNPSIKYVDNNGKEVSTTQGSDGTIYVPRNTKVQISWSGQHNSGFAAERLYIWQPSDGFGKVNDYSLDYANNDMYGLRGNAKAVGKPVGQNSKGKYVITLSIDDFKKVKLLCESRQLVGDGGSAAVGDCEANVNNFYVFTNKPTIEVDSKKPEISYSITGKNHENWYKQGATIKFTGTDADSGIDYLLINGVQQANNYEVTPGKVTTSYTYQAVDKAGLKSNSQSMSINVDGDGPTINATPSNSPINEWYKGETSVTFNVVDNQSGVSSFMINNVARSNNYVLSLPEGTSTYNCQATDNVENSSQKSFTYNVDKSSPTATIAGGVSYFTNKEE